MASKQSFTGAFLRPGFFYLIYNPMENQGRRPDQQENNEMIAFIAVAGLIITILTLIVFSL